MVCEECKATKEEKKGRVLFRRKHNKYLCDSCNVMYTKSPVNENIPSIGKVGYDAEGRIICHECGRAFHRLSTHVESRHNLTPDKYREKFGLNRTQGLMSLKCIKEMSERAKDNKELVARNLLHCGSGTRFKNGHKGRPKYKLREQSLKVLRDNISKINEKR